MQDGMHGSGLVVLAAAGLVLAGTSATAELPLTARTRLGHSGGFRDKTIISLTYKL